MEDEILIDNYLKGLLEENELALFSKRLLSDIEFNEKFKLEEQLFNSLNENSWSFVDNKNSEIKAYTKLLKSTDLQNLKKTLAKTNSEFNSQPQKGVKTRRFAYYLVAASVVVFLGFQFFFNRNVSNQELYNNYVALNDLPSFASRDADSNELVKAEKLFVNENYEKALTIFKSQLTKSSNKGNIFIYQGLSQTELSKYKEAEKTFDNLINSNLLDAEKGYWYKALLFIKSDRVEEAKFILKSIISKSQYNNTKAEELLSDLE